MEHERIKMTKKEYSSYVESKVDKSNIIKNIFLAFIVGGIICVIGQVIANIFINRGIDSKDAIMISTIILIFLGAFLTSIHLYSKLGKHAGAGSILPITGFANSIVAPAIEYKTEGYILGLGSNMFKVAGPVLVYGIFTSFVIGFIHWAMQFVR